MYIQKSIFVSCLFPLLFAAACSSSQDPVSLFEQGKYDQAYSIWLPRAERGEPIAQNYIGIHHYLGVGVSRNYKYASEWYEKAAVQGFPDAQFNLGLMYENGKGVKQDYLTAFKWFAAAYEQGNDNALKHLKRISQEHKLMPNQMAYANELAKPYILHKIERSEQVPRKNY